VEAKIRTETPETKDLSKKLNTPVSIRRTAHGGKLEISFSTDEELASMLRMLLEDKKA
jgi:hypothetical protein